MNNTSVCVSMPMKRMPSLQHYRSHFQNNRVHGLGKSGSEEGRWRSPVPKSAGNGEEEDMDVADVSAGSSTSAECGWSVRSCWVRGSVCLCTSTVVRLSWMGAWMVAKLGWESLDSWRLLSGLRLEPCEEEQEVAHSEPSTYQKRFNEHKHNTAVMPSRTRH